MHITEEELREFTNKLTLEVSRGSYKRGFDAALEMLRLISTELPAREGTTILGAVNALKEASHSYHTDTNTNE